MPDREAVFHSRAEQVLAFLRGKLAEGHWQGRLPPERDLATQLGVSRWTLRGALKELQREGLIGTRSQAGTRLGKPPRGKPGDGRPLSIGLVISNRADLSNGRILYMIDNVRQQLHVREARLEIHKTPYPRHDGLSSHFKTLLRETRHDAWALVAPTLGMQQWCADHRVPAVVIGTGEESFGLANASVDNYAVCRHAVGTMLRHGHRRLALILPEVEKGEDRQSRLGFEAGVREAPHRDAHFTFEVHDQSTPGVCRLADRLLNARQRPTAWFVCRQGHFLTLFTHLLHRGVKIPEELSILCRDWEACFVDLVPQPTAYRANRELLAHQYARLALRVAAGQCLPGEKIRLMPEFIPGQTLGAVPA